MSESWPIAAAESPSVTLRMVLVVAALMAGLFFADRFLAHLEQQEVRREAQRLTAQGDQLLAGGNAVAAAAHYQRAHALFRGDREYALDYARALLAADDRPRAESTLRDLLDRDSNDAFANLLMARTMLAGGDAAAAGPYYHRAIFGAWPSQPAANRIRTRLELADWLARRHARDELLAELLPLQAAVPAHPELRQHVADLLLAAGSPARAAEAYRALLKTKPEDAAAYRGLGEAELQRGNYRAAERNLREALRRNPSDSAIEARLRLVSAVNALDPTPRRLPSIEKYARAGQLVALAAAELRACGTSEKAGSGLLAEADRVASQKPPGAVSNEMSEARLSLAEQLWRARAEQCHPVSKVDDPLPIIMDRLLTPQEGN